MQLPDEVTAEVRRRLRRIAGQIGGIERMLDEGRDCKEVVAQISAATKALEKAGFRLVAEGLTYCIESPEEAKADGYDVDTVQRMFMRMA
jgi:DNA-binding FrmR family transcriptional regulator